MSSLRQHIGRAAGPALRILRAVRWRGNERRCPLCEASLRTFLPFGLNVRPEAQCPVCNALERHRLLWTVIETMTARGELRARGRLLHVAPRSEWSLARRLRKNFEYLSMDIEPGQAMVREDLGSLSFSDGSFDAVVCNHVLEHVQDDGVALREISRVLAPGGWASLLVPMDGEVTREGPADASPAYRLDHFGQEDHLRAYGHDFTRRVEAAGLRVLRVQAENLCGPADLIRMGIPPDEVVVLGFKGERT